MKALSKYRKNHYDFIQIHVPIGFKDIAKEAAAKNNMPLSRAFVKAFCEYYGVDAPSFITDEDPSKRISRSKENNTDGEEKHI